MDTNFHNEVLQKRCPSCDARRGEECRTSNRRRKYPPHKRRWVGVAEARYKAYAKANKLFENYQEV